MKKLTILLLLFTVFVFADWDVDPDYDDLTVGKLVVTGELITPDSVRFIQICGTLWFGGTYTVGATEGYVVSNDVDDNLHAYFINFPQLVAGGTVVIDTMQVNYYTQGVEDSVKFMLLSYQNGAKTKVDSTAWLFGATGWRQSTTIIPEGDVTVVDNTGYSLWADCDNDGAADIRIETAIRVVYHLE